MGEFTEGSAEGEATFNGAEGLVSDNFELYGAFAGDFGANTKGTMISYLENGGEQDIVIAPTAEEGEGIIDERQDANDPEFADVPLDRAEHIAAADYIAAFAETTKKLQRQYERPEDMPSGMSSRVAKLRNAVQELQ